MREDMQLRSMAFVSMSETGGRFGGSLKGRLGLKVMVLIPAFLDTFSEHVGSVDMPFKHVDETETYEHFLSRKSARSMAPRSRGKAALHAGRSGA